MASKSFRYDPKRSKAPGTFGHGPRTSIMSDGFQRPSPHDQDTRIRETPAQPETPLGSVSVIQHGFGPHNRPNAAPYSSSTPNQEREKRPVQTLDPLISHPLKQTRTSPPTASGIRLVNPKQFIPDRFSTVFPYELLNAVQSKCFETIYKTDDNVVISAPTGSGKTALLELAICRLASLKDSENIKVVYLAPTKALCKEKATQWRKTFGLLAMPVSELTGDTSRAEMRNVREAKIIVTTPEKWDSVTRSWADHRKLLDLVGLLLIDEVHILKESRGATLEVVVSRMKTYGSKIRFVALSATIPNSADVAAWLGKTRVDSHLSASREVFGEEFRPVRLEKKVYGIESKLGDHPFDNVLNTQLWKYIEKHSQRKPLLVFCMTRKSCYEAARQLAKEWSQREPRARLWPEPRTKVVVVDANLQDLVQYGVAFHHAGLDADDRRAVHEAFEQGNLSVICCTSTLALGVNLPCHTVLLKGTVCYQDGQICEYSDLEVMQMLGRAGRPQFEDSALAIILTRTRNKKRYEELGSGQQVLESTLHKNLIEHFNSEVSLETFKDAKEARDWLQKTFLSVRLRQNPKLLEARLLGGDSAGFRSTDYGRAMSKYMIRFETMKQIMAIPHGASTQDLANEKDIFRHINSDHFIMYPVNGTVSTMAHKVSLLIQMELGHVEVKVNGLERQRLRSEARQVLEVMHRLIRAVIECKGVDLDGKACWTALELARSMAAKAWEGKAMQLLQVPQVGPVLMRKFVSNNIRTVARLVSTDSGTIERIASRNPPFGKKIIDALATFPRLGVNVRIKDKSTDVKGTPLLHIDAILSFAHKKGDWLGRMPIVTFMAVTTSGFPAYFWRDSLKTFKDKNGTSFQIQFTWSPSEPEEILQCNFACEEIVGTFVSAEIEHGMPASVFPPKPRDALSWTSQCELRQEEDLSHSKTDSEVDDEDLLSLIDNAPNVGTAKDIDDEFATDEDLFAILHQTGSVAEQTHKVDEKSSKIERTKKKPQSKGPEPCIEPTVVRLPNGRYKCGHPCSHFGGPKELGDRDCGHACCRIGNKNPPKKRGANNKRKAYDDEENDEASIDRRPGQPKFKPPVKRTKPSESRSETNSLQSVSRSKSPLSRKNHHPSPDLAYLSGFKIDEEGLMDLTQDGDGYDSENSMQMTSLASSGRKGQSQTKKDEFKRKYFFDDLLDDDFEDLDLDLGHGYTTKMGNGSSVRGREEETHEHDAEFAVVSEIEPSRTDDKPNRGGTTKPSRREAQLRQNHETRGNEADEYMSASRHPQDHLKAHDLGDERIFNDLGLNNLTSWEESIAEPKGDSTAPLEEVNLQEGTKLEVKQNHNDTVGEERRAMAANEPSWLNEFDPDLVDEFRGVVDFV
ncbi:hypothetical protein BD289DRAFT_455819 [Coniella lustricola]|uniref:DNA 3'-5' helicase n=1 Tax=Coniella lustricola TaxID=2025994 RepID=A0A2T2ZYA4_9PEZI|nr:hypothetical protein BD289DRAFT_455819 [Coniella lustricola]